MTSPLLHRTSIPHRLASLTLALLLPAHASAVDGVVEINHACAQTGCFAGDGPGYPVTIALPSSYRLTSNLYPNGADGIEIAAGTRIVTIDLNGFAIDGGGAGGGRGVIGQNSASAIVIRNGTITGMGGDGIDIGGSAVVESVHVVGNGGDGIDVNQTSMVSDCRVIGNAGTGILFSDRSSLFSGIVFSGNGSRSVFLGQAGGQNVCDDDFCNRRGRRRFYLTQTAYPGDQALSACATGYHMASLWEIYDPSHLLYDSDLGRIGGDSGSGPPSGLSGWIRTGYYAADDTSGSVYPAPNCNAWQSTSGSGSKVLLSSDWADHDLEVYWGRLYPWMASEGSCTSSNPVWCLED